MRKEQKSDLPSKAGESPSQKQDPLERRRLQNRLSQRNHRRITPSWVLANLTDFIPGRKIRDRIAKLQERVIANELRAAATLNGWDQPYASSPFMSSHHRSAPYPEPELSFGSPDQSPLSTEPSTPFCPSYPFSNPALCSADISSPQGSAISGDSAYLFDSTCGDLSSSPSKHGIPLMIGSGQSNDMFHNPWCRGIGMGHQAAIDDLATLGSINQAMIYVAPGKTRPINHSHRPKRLTEGIFRKRFTSNTSNTENNNVKLKNNNPGSPSIYPVSTKRDTQSNGDESTLTNRASKSNELQQ